MATIVLFGLSIYPYGLAVAGAALLSLLLAVRNFRKAQLDVNLLSWFAPLALLLGFLGARVSFCLAAFDWVSQEGAGFFFQFTRGGYMLSGAIAGCVLALWLSGRIF